MKKAKLLVCSQCGLPDEIWGFKTSIMPRKIYLCWDHLKHAEQKSAERGHPNLINPKN